MTFVWSAIPINKAVDCSLRHRENKLLMICGLIYEVVSMSGAQGEDFMDVLDGLKSTLSVRSCQSRLG